MKHRYLHRIYGSSRIVRTCAMNVMSRLELLGLGGHKSSEILDLIRTTRQERESLLSSNEAFLVYSVARAQSTLPGVMAEVGVYQGCSAKLISTASNQCCLHLFDTFDGLPEPGDGERGHLRGKQYRSSLSSVRSFLGACRNVFLHPGHFPDTARGLEGERFSFVHLDVDLKSSTRDCLEFFYPRMVPGGIIMTHDFSFLDGVREAFAEFLDGKPGQLIELQTSQAILVCPAGTAMAPTPTGSHNHVQELSQVLRQGAAVG